MSNSSQTLGRSTATPEREPRTYTFINSTARDFENHTITYETDSSSDSEIDSGNEPDNESGDEIMTEDTSLYSDSSSDYDSEADVPMTINEFIAQHVYDENHRAIGWSTMRDGSRVYINRPWDHYHNGPLTDEDIGNPDSWVEDDSIWDELEMPSAGTMVFVAANAQPVVWDDNDSGYYSGSEASSGDSGYDSDL